MQSQEYQPLLRALALSKAQKNALETVLEESFIHGGGRFDPWFDGLEQAVNQMFRFACGDLLSHDAFVEPEDVVSLEAPVFASAEYRQAQEQTRRHTQALAERLASVLKPPQLVGFRTAMQSLAEMPHSCYHDTQAFPVAGEDTRAKTYYLAQSAYMSTLDAALKTVALNLTQTETVDDRPAPSNTDAPSP